MNEESLFSAALEKANPAERQVFLDEACAGDARLRRRVEKLLAADGEPLSILDQGQSAAAILGVYQPTPPLAAEQAFAGRFRLLRQLGQGGMGEVWVADQTEPVQRQVALKVIKPGMGTARLLARFEAERRALALMDHPNIGKVLDAGVVGPRPFFVMELIDGSPITRHCGDARLSLRERVELFVPVCRAVQHAHHKGVIHRDLKPANILVTAYDGKPVPKVIDFGIAKAAGAGSSGPAAPTEVGTVLGTLEYMSPEQAEANDLDVDTRSDVYSLGVVLYELLTGTVPFSRQQLQSLPLPERLRVIREVEPPTPSARLSELGRSGEPGRAAAPASQVRGELDWIVMKCLEKDRDRRYETANAVAMDLKRYLADESVLAGPPSKVYRLRKFLCRHRGPALAAGLVLLALVAGLVGLVWAVNARQAERLAKETADKRLEQLEKGIDLLASVFTDLDPRAEEKEARPLRAILGDRLDRAAAELEGEAVGDPLVVARLQDRLGQTYLGLGQAVKAEALFARAAATSQAHLGPDHVTTLDRLDNQAWACREAGQLNEAIGLFERVRDAKERTLGADDPSTHHTLNNLAVAYWRVGKVTLAITLLERVRDASIKQYGDDAPRTLATQANLAGTYVAANRFDEAIALSEKVLAAKTKRYGETHALTIGARINLAEAYQAGYKMRQALTLLEEGRGVVEPKLGSDHQLTLLLIGNLASLYRSYGKTRQALELGEPVRERMVTILGAHHPVTLHIMDTLGLAYQDAGKLDKALPLLRQAATGVERVQFANDSAAAFVSHLCDCHERRKEYAEAEVWWRKCLAVVKVKHGADSAAYADALTGLGSNLLRQGKHADAEPALREGLVLLERKRPDAWETCVVRSRLGAALLGQKKYAAAEPYLVGGYQGMCRWADRLGSSHAAFTRKPLTDTLGRLVQLYDGWGKPAEAAKWRMELEEREDSARE